MISKGMPAFTKSAFLYSRYCSKSNTILRKQGGVYVKKGLRRMYIAFLSPVIFTFVFIYLYPVIRTFQMSLYKIPSINAPQNLWQYVGLGNYQDLMTRQLFKVAF